MTKREWRLDQEGEEICVQNWYRDGYKERATNQCSEKWVGRERARM